MPALDVKEPSWLGLVVCGSECVSGCVRVVVSASARYVLLLLLLK
jgi:hypothetical protein